MAANDRPDGEVHPAGPCGQPGDGVDSRRVVIVAGIGENSQAVADEPCLRDERAIGVALQREIRLRRVLRVAVLVERNPRDRAADRIDVRDKEVRADLDGLSGDGRGGSGWCTGSRGRCGGRARRRNRTGGRTRLSRSSGCRDLRNWRVVIAFPSLPQHQG